MCDGELVNTPRHLELEIAIRVCCGGIIRARYRNPGPAQRGAGLAGLDLTNKHALRLAFTLRKALTRIIGFHVDLRFTLFPQTNRNVCILALTTVQAEHTQLITLATKEHAITTLGEIQLRATRGIGRRLAAVQLHGYALCRPVFSEYINQKLTGLNAGAQCRHGEKPPHCRGFSSHMPAFSAVT